VALIQESLAVAHNTGHWQPAISTGSWSIPRYSRKRSRIRPMRRCAIARWKNWSTSRRHHVPLWQSYQRVAKHAAIMVGRYTHAHQFKRARRALKFLRIRLGRVIRDIRRKIADNQALKERFADLLALAVRVRFQDHRRRGPRSTRCTPPRSNASASAKPGRRTSSAARDAMGRAARERHHRRCKQTDGGAPWQSRMI
jgi:transposase, IS5 family